MILYHFTHKNNVKSILKNGLRANLEYDSGLTLHKKRKVVFLTSDSEYIKKVALHPEEYTRLEIDCSNLKIQPEYDWSIIYTSPEFYPKTTTFISKRSIASKRIRRSGK
jgi:hypothetical protein